MDKLVLVDVNIGQLFMQNVLHGQVGYLDQMLKYTLGLWQNVSVEKYLIHIYKKIGAGLNILNLQVDYIVKIVIIQFVMN